MNFYLIIQGKAVVVMAGMKGESDAIGDYFQEIYPGGEFNGISYGQLRKVAEQERRIVIDDPTRGKRPH